MVNWKRPEILNNELGVQLVRASIGYDNRFSEYSVTDYVPGFGYVDDPESLDYVPDFEKSEEREKFVESFLTKPLFKIRYGDQEKWLSLEQIIYNQMDPGKAGSETPFVDEFGKPFDLTPHLSDKPNVFQDMRNDLLGAKSGISFDLLGSLGIRELYVGKFEQERDGQLEKLIQTKDVSQVASREIPSIDAFDESSRESSVNILMGLRNFKWKHNTPDAGKDVELTFKFSLNDIIEYQRKALGKDDAMAYKQQVMECLRGISKDEPVSISLNDDFNICINGEVIDIQSSRDSGYVSVNDSRADSPLVKGSPLSSSELGRPGTGLDEVGISNSHSGPDGPESSYRF